MDTSLGYYINPLLNVLLGVIIFKEVLTFPKKLSVAIAALGIAFLTWQLGSLPWISVALAVSFGLYGAVKKKLIIHPFTSIALEAWIVTPSRRIVYDVYRHIVMVLFRHGLEYDLAVHRIRPDHIGSAHTVFVWRPPVAA